RPQPPAGPPKAGSGAVLESPSAPLLAQPAPDALTRRCQLPLEPAIEDAREQAARHIVGGHLELRINPRLHRPLAQQLGAECVDGADARDLELRQGVPQVLTLGRRSALVLTVALDRRTQAELQL